MLSVVVLNPCTLKGRKGEGEVGRGSEKRKKEKRKRRGTGTERKGTGRGRDGGVGKITIMRGLEKGKVQFFIKRLC